MQVQFSKRVKNNQPPARVWLRFADFGVLTQDLDLPVGLVFPREAVRRGTKPARTDRARGGSGNRAVSTPLARRSPLLRTIFSSPDWCALFRIKFPRPRSILPVVAIVGPAFSLTECRPLSKRAIAQPLQTPESRKCDSVGQAFSLTECRPLSKRTSAQPLQTPESRKCDSVGQAFSLTECRRLPEARSLNPCKRQSRGNVIQ